MFINLVLITGLITYIAVSAFKKLPSALLNKKTIIRNRKKCIKLDVT